ncbi:MAG: CapA family protein [Actinomycetia bacterium]|nr:CapA family protein [Actinomycetes bacterium]
MVLFLLPVLFIFSVSFMLSSCTLFDNGTGGQDTLEEAEEDPMVGDSLNEGTSKEEGEEEDPGDEVQEELPVKIWIEDMIPEEIKNILIGRINSDPYLEQAKDSGEAEAFLEIVPAGALANGSASYKDLDIFYVMAPSTFFFNILDEIEWEDLKAWWSGDKESLSHISEDGIPVNMALEEQDHNILVKILGETANENIQIMERSDIMEGLSDGSITISITPFDRVDKRIKVLKLSGLSVFDRELDYNRYPLAFSVMLRGEDEAIIEEILSSLNDIGMTNRDMSKFTSLIMTGVTAMVRGTAQRMENHGISYPGEKIADILREADITHISNEVPFVEGCNVFENRFPFFCSRPEYIELLEYVGADVIELTGNHMNDHGHDWFIYTLEMYDNKGWPYYGGGRDLEESYAPAVIESNGHKFAFLGFNWWGPAYDWATEDTPGSAPREFEEFEAIIKDLKEQGHIVIFTFQYIESYQYKPTPQQVIDFRRMIDAGADIISGSQSHHPMGMEFYGDGFINYGLGNLFFDQMRELGTRQELIAKHIFYEGKHINTIIITAMLEDYSQPRPATAEERSEILNSVFEASIK